MSVYPWREDSQTIAQSVWAPVKLVPITVVQAESAEQAVRFSVRAGGEIKRLLSPAVIAEFEGPQPINNHRLSVGFVQRNGGAAGHWIERIDLAVTEIPDQQLAAEFTEGCWRARRRERQAPGRVERAARGETLQVVAGKTKCVHDPVPWARDIVVPPGSAPQRSQKARR